MVDGVPSFDTLVDRAIGASFLLGIGLTTTVAVIAIGASWLAGILGAGLATWSLVSLGRHAKDLKAAWKLSLDYTAELQRERRAAGEAKP